MAGDDVHERRPDEMSAGHTRSPPHSAYTPAACRMCDVRSEGGGRVEGVVPLDEDVRPVYIRPRTDHVWHAQGALALAEPAPHGPPSRRLWRELAVLCV